MPRPTKSSREYNGSGSGSGYKRRGVAYEEDEDEYEDFRAPRKKSKGNHDYCCEPPDIEYCPECICIEPPDSCTGSDQPKDRAPCVPVCCRPCPYWEREIVKFNPGAKWDPQIEEKGESGHPNLKGKDGKRGNSKSRRHKKNKTDEKDKFIAIGEPCNAYKCYKDPCVPKGMAYCVPKHPKRNPLPACPQKFPIKPIRFQMCAMEEEAGNQTTTCGCGSTSRYCNQTNQRLRDPESCINNDGHYGQAQQDCIPDPCSNFYKQAANQQQSSYDAGAQQGSISHNNNNNCGSDASEDYCSCCEEEGSSKKSKIPEEWLQELPLCDSSKRPSLNSKSKKSKRKNKNSGPNDRENSYYGE